MKVTFFGHKMTKAKPLSSLKEGDAVYTFAIRRNHGLIDHCTALQPIRKELWLGDIWTYVIEVSGGGGWRIADDDCDLPISSSFSKNAPYSNSAWAISTDLGMLTELLDSHHLNYILPKE